MKQYLSGQNPYGFCSISMQKKEVWHGKNLNSNFRCDCGSNRRNFKGGLNYGRKEITERKNIIRKKIVKIRRK